MSNFFIIGGGWSATEVHTNALRKYGSVIGVNDAALWADVDTCLTMDRLWFENRLPYLKARRVPSIWVREKCDCNIKDPKRWTTFKHLREPGLSHTKGTLYGSNSGTCAINLAYQWMHEGSNLFLIGFDMCKGPNGEPYWYPPYPWAQPEGSTKPGHFRDWLREFDMINSVFVARGMNVYNVSSRSAIGVFPKLSFDSMMGMLS